MLNTLQIVRGLSAYAIVYYHLSRFLYFGGVAPAPHPEILTAGVDVFFVLSGFIIVTVTGPKESPGWYTLKRIARIVPLYWGVTALTIALAVAVPWAYQEANLSPQSILSAFAFLPYPDADGHIYPPLIPGWTLNLEMLFYALFAVAMFVTHRWRAWLVIALLGGVWLVARLAEGAGHYAVFYSNPMFLEFAIGCLIAKFIKLDLVARFCRAVPMWPLIVLAVGLLVASDMVLPAAYGNVRYFAPCALLVFAAAGQDVYRKGAKPGFFTHLGDASYSAYLLHSPVITLVGVPAMKLLPQGPLQAVVIFVGVLAGTVALSALSLAWFEKPVNTFFRRAYKTVTAGKAPAPSPAPGNG